MADFSSRFAPRPQLPGTDPSIRTYGDPYLGQPQESSVRESFGTPPTSLEQKHLTGDQLAQAMATSRAAMTPMGAVSHATDVFNNHVNNLHWELGANDA